METETQNKMLIVDDELSVCRGCERIFKEEGYSIKFALSGEEGLEKAEKEIFDVIIVDLKMPDMSGMDIVKTIRQKQPDVALIMITGYASVPTAVEAMKLGAQEYLPKPFTPDEITQVVEKALERVRSSRRPESGDEVEGEVIEKQQVLEVLNRASADSKFWGALFEDGSKALDEYDLSTDARAAIITGDINWIEEHVGKLTKSQLDYLMTRLQVEKW